MMLALDLVLLDAWCNLEERLARQYPKSSWRQQHILKLLLRLAWWRIPTTAEAWDETGGLSRHGLARRRRQASAELDMMASLPALTRDPVLQHQVNFGILPATAIVRPDDRHLTFCHLWALCDRRVAADLVCNAIGGRWLVPLTVLEDELRQRDDDIAVEQLQDAQANAQRRRTETIGPQAIAIML